MINSPSTPLLHVTHLRTYLKKSSIFNELRKEVKIVDDVSFTMYGGETIGIMGETGSGKSTLLETILGLREATSGYVYFDLPDGIFNRILYLEKKFDGMDGISQKSLSESDLDEYNELRSLRREYSVTKRSRKTMRKLRNHMQPVFQNSSSSLDPRKIVRDIIAEPLWNLTDLNRFEIFQRVEDVILEVGLSNEHLYRYPHELNEGQLQQVCIARAIVLQPKLLVLDEPTSSMDMSVKAKIINILRELQLKMNLAYIVVSNHPDVIGSMCDRVAIMYLGKIVELSSRNEIFRNMLHPYSKALFSAIPEPWENARSSIPILKGEIPSMSDPPGGCSFHPRCPSAMKICGWGPSELVPVVRVMLDPYRNREVKDMKQQVASVTADKETNSVVLYFGKDVTVLPDTVEEISSLVEKESLLESGIIFKAVESVERSGDGNRVILKLLEPVVPVLEEIIQNHHVSCFLYSEKDQERKEDEEAGII
ncbi:MAG: ABC transporter ATP-binding protein [Candidatus Thermoplasmatota archaeon]|nr:ABC transporter ATP-binding protein [Candidatus Thermoplasmatota archaeon]MCL5665454.1 ABC transporter ATP-binding protein [Candidatus Thermoplasmatota archaeon]